MPALPPDARDHPAPIPPGPRAVGHMERRPTLLVGSRRVSRSSRGGCEWSRVLFESLRIDQAIQPCHLPRSSRMVAVDRDIRILWSCCRSDPSRRNDAAVRPRRNDNSAARTSRRSRTPWHGFPTRVRTGWKPVPHDPRVRTPPRTRHCCVSSALIRAAAVMRRSDRGGTITEPRGRAGDPVRCGTGFQPVSAPVGNGCHTTRGSGRPRVHDTAVSAVR
jgi:hypothetical protein